MSEYEVEIERHGYNRGVHTYRVRKGSPWDGSLDAAIEALRTHLRHGLDYPRDGELSIRVGPVEPPNPTPPASSEEEG